MTTTLDAPEKITVHPASPKTVHPRHNGLTMHNNPPNSVGPAGLPQSNDFNGCGQSATANRAIGIQRVTGEVSTPYDTCRRCRMPWRACQCDGCGPD